MIVEKVRSVQATMSWAAPALGLAPERINVHAVVMVGDGQVFVRSEYWRRYERDHRTRGSKLTGAGKMMSKDVPRSKDELDDAGDEIDKALSAVWKVAASRRLDVDINLRADGRIRVAFWDQDGKHRNTLDVFADMLGRGGLRTPGEAIVARIKDLK